MRLPCLRLFKKLASLASFSFIINVFAPPPFPIMVFNARIHRDLLRSLKSYLPTDSFLTSYGWSQDGSANILVDKQTKRRLLLFLLVKWFTIAYIAGHPEIGLPTTSMVALKTPNINLLYVARTTISLPKNLMPLSNLLEKFRPRSQAPRTAGTYWWARRTRSITLNSPAPCLKRGNA